MVFTPLSRVLIGLFLGLVVTRVAIFSLSLVLWVGVAFSLLWL